MIADLPAPTQEHPDPRDEYVDGPLQVETWPRIGDQKPRHVEPVEPGAPSWWHGEEEASETFLKAMGLQLAPDGAVVKR